MSENSYSPSFGVVLLRNLIEERIRQAASRRAGLSIVSFCDQPAILHPLFEIEPPIIQGRENLGATVLQVKLRALSTTLRARLRGWVG